jgi:hypothetical protein
MRIAASNIRFPLFVSKSFLARFRGSLAEIGILDLVTGDGAYRNQQGGNGNDHALD